MTDKMTDSRVSQVDIVSKANFDYEGAHKANDKIGDIEEGRDLLNSGSALSVAELDVYAESAKLDSEKAKLEDLLAHDRLTGLKSERELNRVLKSIQDGNLAATLFFVDIDHFKETNDEYGHKVGDDVLEILGQRLMAHVEGVVGRKGGEEFLVILQGDISAEIAEKRAGEVRKLIEDSAFATSSVKLNKTISIGVAQRKENSGEKSDDWVLRADAALYLAKQSGRNNVKVWERDVQK